MSQNTEYTVDPSRLVSPDAAPADAAEEVSLRPKTLDDYIGQEKAKNNLRIYLRAAQQRGEPMDHILLYGPPGRGIEKAQLSVLLKICIALECEMSAIFMDEELVELVKKYHK